MAGSMKRTASVQEVRERLADPLATCRDGTAGIGFVGPDVPIEVLIASRRPFGHLPWRPYGATQWADQWLESGFPFWSRSILEQWHDGVFDCLETVVFSRADDASQRLYYYVAELQRRGKLGGPAPRIFDIALIRRASSQAHTEAALKDLMQAFEVTADSLHDGIERANRLRRRLAELERGRTANGPLHEQLFRAALWTDPCHWLDAVVIPDATPATQRILLAGSVPPDERLHDAVEATGASVVAEAHAFASDRLGPELEIGDRGPAGDLAFHLCRHSIAPRAFIDRAAWLMTRFQAARADAVVLWLAREDEALAWPVPAQQHALEVAGVPALLLAAARWQVDDDTPQKIADFIAGAARASA